MINVEAHTEHRRVASTAMIMERAFVLTFSIERCGVWLPYLGYGDVTVAADCRGRVTVQTPWLLITVPRQPWWPITAETCRANAVVFYYCTKNTVLSVYRGSVPCKCRDF